MKLHVRARQSNGHILLDRWIDKFPCKIGRSHDCDIQVYDKGLSLYHAVLSFDDGIWILRDLNSHNGVYLQDLNGTFVRHDKIDFQRTSHTWLGAVEFELVPEDEYLNPEPIPVKPGHHTGHGSFSHWSHNWKFISGMAISTSLATLIFTNALDQGIGEVWGSRDQSRKDLPQNVIQSLNRSVFEVVIPKVEDDFVRYQKDIPWERLSFKERNDKFHSVGTAFFMDKNRFVSAAHVFSPIHRSNRKGFFLRDSQGNTYPITDVLQYSEQRDLIVFSIKGTIPDSQALKIDTDNAIGNVVFTVGNALGEGIAVRSGNISSYTPELIDGKWSYIRFSAPASPGNSGGPLLKANGHVIGVVTMKTADENLNYAVPIAELNQLSENLGEFYFKGLGEVESGQQLFEDRRFEVSVPALIEKFSSEAAKKFVDGQIELRKKFEIKFQDLIFPGSTHLPEYLLRQEASFSFAELDFHKQSSRWSLSSDNASEKKIDGTRSADVGRVLNATSAILERPLDLSISEYVQNAQFILEDLLKVSGWARTVAGERVEILSYGPPHDVNEFEDEHGRLWQSAIWRMGYDNRFHLLTCTAHPKGAACLWNYDSSHEEDFARYYQRLALKQLLLGYQGTFSQWKDYFALDSKWIAPWFREGKIHWKSGYLDFHGGARIAGKLDSLSNSSRIDVGMAFHPWNAQQLRIHELRVFSNPKSSGFQLTLGQLRPPHPDSNEEIKNFWKRVSRKEAPFDGQIRERDNGILNQTLIADHTFRYESPQQGVLPRTPATEAQSTSQKSIVYWTCRGQPGQNRQAFTRLCQDFRKFARPSP